MFSISMFVENADGSADALYWTGSGYSGDTTDARAYPTLGEAVAARDSRTSGNGITHHIVEGN